MSLYVGPVWELKLRSLFLEQVCLNVFFYGTFSGSTASAADVGAALAHTLMPGLLPVTSDNTRFVDIQVRGVRDATDLAVTDLDGVFGDVSGDALPPYAAWAFRYNRDSTLYRNGYKRFVGVPESQQFNGTPTVPAEALLQLLGDTLGMNINIEDPDNVYQPLVRQTIVGGAPVGPLYYTVPEGSVDFVNISTQNSRKFGHGI